MIGYVTVGTNDRERSLAFYDALLGEMGAARVPAWCNDNFTFYGTGKGSPGLAVTRPHDGVEARPGNGAMVALSVESRAKVDALHAKALELGGSDEGAPGVRGAEGPKAFYGAYFRDPDGNKFCAFKIGPG
jgi:catechol 2,3-dioxygenase-like lactoylglutathione lyase family enzyme